MIYRPLLWCFGFAAFGEVLAGWMGQADGYQWIPIVIVPVILWILFSIPVIGVKKEKIRKKKWQTELIRLSLPFFFLVGFWRYRNQENHWITFPVETEGQILLLDGTIENMEERTDEIRMRVRGKLGKLSSDCTVLVTWETEKLQEIGTEAAEGKRICCFVKARLLSKKRNPGQFDGEAYYKQLGIHMLAKGQRVQQVTGRENLLFSGLRHIRRWMAEGIQRAAGESDITCGLLRGILLGEKWAVDEEVKEEYEACGIGHLLAISGLHVSMIGMTLFRLLRKRLQCSYLGSAGICVGISLCYVILTGRGSSAYRAFFMLALYGTGQILGREYDVTSAVSFAGLMMILKNPFLIFFSGFQLSCGSVLALGLFYPELQKRVQNPLIRIFLPGISIQTVTLPIQAMVFYKIPVYAIFLNLLVLPTFSVVVALGFVSGFLGGLSSISGLYFLKNPGRWLCFPAGILLKLYRILGKFSLGLKGSLFRCGEPKTIQIFLYAAFFFLLYLKLRNGNRDKRKVNKAEKSESKEKGIRGKGKQSEGGKNKRRKTGRRGYGYGICIGLLPLFLLPIPSGKLEVTFLDVGQGDSCMIRTPGGSTILMDGGSSDESDVGDYILEPFLDSQAVDRVTVAIATHGDSDHINGLTTLLADGRIENLLLADNWKQRDKLKKLGETAAEYGVHILEVSQGDCLQVGSATLTCLWPESGKGAEEKKDSLQDESDENESSLVFWFGWKETDILFTGDLEGTAETQVEDLLGKLRKNQKETRNSLELLKVAHHGSGKTSSEGFLQKAAAEIAIISCGKNNRYGHPAGEALERLRKAGCRIRRTDQEGAIRFCY